jgi:hypothetical protein
VTTAPIDKDLGRWALTTTGLLGAELKGWVEGLRTLALVIEGTELTEVLLGSESNKPLSVATDWWLEDDGIPFLLNKFLLIFLRVANDEIDALDFKEIASSSIWDLALDDFFL